MVFTGTVSVWEDGRVLEVDDGDGCTTVWMHLMSLNCALEIGEGGQFDVLYIYHD